LAQLGVAQPPRQPLVVPARCFLVDQQAEPVLARQVGRLRASRPSSPIPRRRVAAAGRPRPSPHSRTGRVARAAAKLLCNALRNGDQAMPRGRKPESEHALSNAERQARYRARRAAQASPIVIRTRRPSDQRSRPQRWREAVDDLLVLQADYAAWLDALPDSLRDSPTAEALEAIADLDLTTLTEIEPPRGYGRD